MVSRVHKRTAMYRNLQLLRSITYSRSHRKTSVLLDATEYIQGLKQKLEELNQLPVVDYDPMPKLKVETQEEGFVIKVVSERSCQGLLVFILEAFEELGLDVLQARVSCAENFCLEAVVNKSKNIAVAADRRFGPSDQSDLDQLTLRENNQDTSPLDAQLVEQVVSRAIQNWKEATQHDI